jgi:queuine tRNA-ribosyltransferase
MKFKILKKSKLTKARLGLVKTNHGVISTPNFLPDATRGYVKQVANTEVLKSGISAMVVNTFHLLLQPGIEEISKAGGIHQYANWPMPLLSDSGGFQIFSLVHQKSQMGKITEDQVTFKSPINGSLYRLTPEQSIELQFKLGTDMIVCFDDCPPNDSSAAELNKSVERTIKWAHRCKDEYARQIKKRKIDASKSPIFFAVIQGGLSRDMRRHCADELNKIGFDGYGLGARPVDSQGIFLEDIIGFTAEQIPVDKIRFALGTGTPLDIVRSTALGWDLFDCVIPTREGRHGRLFYFDSKIASNLKTGQSLLHNHNFYHIINISNTANTAIKKAINPHSRHPDLRTYSLGFLRHLFKTGDPLGQRLASLNNLEFYANLMCILRLQIKNSIF